MIIVSISGVAYHQEFQRGVHVGYFTKASSSTIVKDLFLTYGIIKCAVTGSPLFHRRAWKKSQKLCSMPFEEDMCPIRPTSRFITDTNGLSTYRCSRGTNSVEGGIHQNIRRKFGNRDVNASRNIRQILVDYIISGFNINSRNPLLCWSFSAGPFFTDCALADYRLRHNIVVRYTSFYQESAFMEFSNN